MNDMTDSSWKSYEDVAQHLLNGIASEFRLGRVEGKQIVPGESGTEWEIDAKGILLSEEGFLIVECWRHTKSGLSQESVAGIAYRIEDTGATGRIIVSPMPLQEGAQKVAQHEGISHVRLSPESTTTDYVLQFLNKTFVGLSDKLSPMTDTLTVSVKRAACNADRHEACPGECACECHGDSPPSGAIRKA